MALRDSNPEPPANADARCVWLTDELCGCIYTALAQAYPGQIEKADEFHAHWKAAPTDLYAATIPFIPNENWSIDDAAARRECRALMDDILRALGYPWPQ